MCKLYEIIHIYFIDDYSYLLAVFIRSEAFIESYSIIYRWNKCKIHITNYILIIAVFTLTFKAMSSRVVLRMLLEWIHRSWSLERKPTTNHQQFDYSDRRKSNHLCSHSSHQVLVRCNHTTWPTLSRVFECLFVDWMARVSLMVWMRFDLD